MPIQPFFTFAGQVGTYDNPTAYTYRAYRCPDSTVWFMKGRMNIDFDGAPNCYAPGNPNLLPLAQYATVDIMNWNGCLDDWHNGQDNGTWTSVVTDGNNNPLTQGPNDPFPGYYISTVQLYDDNYPQSDPRHWADARAVPYFALNNQILQEAGNLFTRIADGHTGNFGDYVTAIDINTGNYAHALIGDNGFQPMFGEASYALGRAIGRVDGPEQPEILYIVYPHTGVGNALVANPNIAQIGEALYGQWGGSPLVQQVLTEMG